MADDPEKDRPSLELPRLSLRRKRRPAPEGAAPAAAPPAPPEPVSEARSLAVEEPPEPVVRPAQGAQPEAPARSLRIRRERGPGGMTAAVVVGLVVGLGVVGLTWASLRSCEGIQGTSSCGDAGYPMLGLILAGMVVLGWLLLRLLRVADPGSTSFLGVGLTCVVALLLLVDHLMDASMVVVIPLLCAATFALAHWVTRTYIEPPRD